MQWRSHPVLMAIGAFFAGLVVVIVVLMLAWDWNWFRPMVERLASSALERPVTIGNLDASLLHMTIKADDIVIDNPEGFPNGSRFGSIERLSLTIDPQALFQRRFHIPALIIDKPNFDLVRAGSGKANWEIGSSKSSSSSGSGPGVLLGSVIINDGHVHLVDPKLKSNFAINVNTEQPPNGGEPMIVLAANGTYTAQPLAIHFRGGSLLSLRDKNKPYPIDLKADHGETHVSVKGTVQDPSSFGGANVQMHLEGRDLSELSHLIAVPLAPTPPYRLDGHLDYANKSIRFDDFSGKVGNSDLTGKFAVEPGRDRPKISADMTSQNIDLTDLGGFIGTTPGKSSTPGQTQVQKQEHAETAAKSTLLPSKPMNLSAVRNNDFDVHYTAKRIEGQSIPLDNLEAHLVISGGIITLDPLKFGVGVGNIASKIDIDARQKEPVASAEVDLQRVDLNRVMQSTKTFQGAGLIGGHAVLKGHGASTADMLGTSNGNIKFFMSGGDMSALLVNLAGLDFGNSLLSALGIPSQTPIRCMVSDFDVKDGVLDTKLLVLDTTEANVVGQGDIDLHDEKINYRIKTEPKHASIGSVPAPITITGTLKSPKIGVEAGALGARAGAAAVLGVLLTPLGALIPTIQLGLGKDSDCNGLIASVQNGQDTPAAGGEKK
jgi:AsmA family protein